MKHTSSNLILALASLCALAATSSVSLAASASWNVNASGNWTTDANWNPASAPGATSGTTNADIATFALSLGGTRTITVDANRNIGGITFGANNGTNFGYTLSGGNLLLSSGGIIQIDSTATSAGAGTQNSNIGSAIALQGDASFLSNGASARVLNVTGAITSVGNRTLTLGGSSIGTTGVSSITSSAGNNIALVKEGTGTWTIGGTSSNNTIGGGVTVKEGTLNIGSSTSGTNNSLTNIPSVSLGDTTPSNTKSATFNVYGGGTTTTLDAPITVNAGSSGTLKIGRAGSGVATVRGGITLANNLTLENITVGTVGISGTGNLTMTGTSVLNPANSFTGTITVASGTTTLGNSNTNNNVTAWTINGGTLAASTAAALTGNSAAINVNNTGTLKLGTGGSQNYTNVINVADGGAFASDTSGQSANRVATFGSALNISSGGTAATVSFANNGSGSVTANFGATTLGGNTTFNVTNTGVNGSNGFSAPTLASVSGGSYSFTKDGPGSLIIRGSSNTWGNTFVTGGTLRIAAIDALPTTTTLAIGANGTFDLSSNAQGLAAGNYNQQVAGLNDISGAGGTVVANGSSTSGGAVSLVTTRTLTVGGNGTYSFSGTLVDNTSGTGSKLAFTKTGSGIQTLGGNNTYTGDTTVNAGTLLISSTGSIAAGSAVTVQTGAAIGGDGTINGNLTLDSGAKFVFDLNNTPLTVSGTFALNNTFGVSSLVTSSLAAIDWSTVNTGTYKLIATTFTFNASNIQNFGSANAFVSGGKQIYFENGSLDLIVAVPEPATWALLAFSLTTVMVLRRRKHA